MAGVIDELVENVLGTDFESLDKELVDHAKDRILDVIGCTIAGANATGCPEVLDLVRHWGGREESTVLIHGDKAPAQNVAMMNSLMARSYDYEPVEPWVDGVNTPAHISGTTVPVALTVGEQMGVSGKELVTALILGDDIASRLVASSGFAFELGWDNTGTANMFGATAIAGRLQKLDSQQMRNAFGIVLNQLSGSFQNLYDAVHSFKLPMAIAARAGILSAEMAGRGFTGIKDPLFSRHGYFALYCKNPDPGVLTKDLGKRFYADNTFKPYPSCRGTHAAVECTLQLTRTQNINWEDIKEITVNATPGACNTFVGVPFEIGDTPQVNATFSIRYTVANIFFRGSIKLEHFSEASIREPKLLQLIKKVVLKPTLPPEKPLASGIDVVLKDGRRFSAYVEVPKGDRRYNPITKEELVEKFRRNVTFSRTVSDENADKVLGLIRRLEDVSDVRKIIEALIK